MNKAVFLDRDGVINKANIIDSKAYSPRKFEDFKLFNGVKEAIEGFKRKGYLVIVITNQPEISRGFLNMQELEKMHAFIKTELGVDDIIVCLHDDIHNCECRKPKPGLLFQAAEKWQLDLENSYMVGDRWKDILAGEAVGCKTVLIENPAKGDCNPNFVVNNLLDLNNILVG